jgi:hypothetical protein
MFDKLDMNPEIFLTNVEVSRFSSHYVSGDLEGMTMKLFDVIRLRQGSVRYSPM